MGLIKYLLSRMFSENLAHLKYDPFEKTQPAQAISDFE